MCRTDVASASEIAVYSLRMSSTKAVSRSSPISLYFSFSITSSSKYQKNMPGNDEYNF